MRGLALDVFSNFTTDPYHTTRRKKVPTLTQHPRLDQRRMTPPSNEFLSGEAEPQLGSMLGSLSISSKFEKSAKVQVIDSDDETPPPPLDASIISASPSPPIDKVDDDESLMEQMMKEAMKARETEEKKKKAMQQKSHLIMLN